MSKAVIDNVLHYCHVKRKGCSPIKMHVLDYYDLTFVLEGELVYVIDDISYSLKENDVIFLPPNTLRERAPGTDFVNYVSFNFRFTGKFPLTFDKLMPNSLTVDIKRLLSLYQVTRLSSLPNSEAKCVCLLNYILFELSDVVAVNSRNLHVAKILSYIKAHETRKITLKDISEYTNLSKEYCSYLFKSEMKQTLIHYVNEQKISLAKRLILNHEMPLTDICYYLGYDHYNYFSRLFKKHAGIPPTVFLAELNQEALYV